MENANSFLMNWAIRFIENKDSIRREIIKIEKGVEGFDFAVSYKDKVKYFFIKLQLDSSIFTKIRDSMACGIFTLNNISNIRFIATEWRKLSDFKLLNIYFANPFSGMDKVWAINPYTHNKVCDLSTLELGLMSMAELVATLGIEEFISKVKSIEDK